VKNRRPKLFPPLALLAPAAAAAGAPAAAATLSGHELRRIVADLIG
jgi:hypothetical protein